MPGISRFGKLGSKRRAEQPQDHAAPPISIVERDGLWAIIDAAGAVIEAGLTHAQAWRRFDALSAAERGHEDRRHRIDRVMGGEGWLDRP